MTNKIKKVYKEFEIVENDEKSLFTLNTKGNKIKIYDEDILENVIDNRFNKKYRELLYLVMSINEDEDSTESDEELALIKIEDFKTSIIEKYFKYISKGKLNKYMQMLIMLEEKINRRERGKGR